jgi:membrane fusion protein, heavy metal efflux system
MLRATTFGLFMMAISASAHEGHDHGPPPPEPTTQVLAPRASAESADFELVAVLEEARILVYLDAFATNEPIEDAALELETGSFQAKARHLGQGVYEIPPGPLAEPGRHELIFTVQTPTAADLLLGSLDVPREGGTAASDRPEAPTWYESPPVLQGAVAILSLCVLVLLLRRDRRASRPLGPPASPVAVALLAAALLGLGGPGPAKAHEGHDHGEPTPPPVGAGPGGSAGSPIRLPDGSLLVPKPVQRLLGLRTAAAEPGEWPDTFTLTGHVIPDPNASALVQAPLPGRIELPEEGLPLLGERVRQGQVLAFLVPILDAVDRTTLQADLAEIEGRVTILSRNLERLRQLGANAPRQELEQTEAELESLIARRKAIADSFAERLPLTAPVAGVLALRNATPGQIVSGRETLFTLVDPERLWVEALLYDTDHASHFVAASARTAEGRELRLTPLGGGYELRGHALPIQFRIEQGPTGPAQSHLVVRQPLSVTAQMYHGSAGLRIPTAAIQPGADGAARVWVHVRPEHFRPQAVEARELGDGHSVVTQGLSAGDRVVSVGGSLLSQVR